MIRYEEALARIEEACRRSSWQEESVPLVSAPGRVLARELRAALDLPRFDNSAMDGFAVHSSATGSPARLEVQETTVAGDPSVARLRGKGFAVEIMTGAPLPEGADAVARLEDATLEREGARIFAALRRAVAAGENVRRRGSDQGAGAPLAAPGDCLRSGHLPVLAAQGFDRVPVRRKPRARVIATGKELVSPGAELAFPSQIYNSSSVLLEAWLRGFGAEVDPPLFAGDDAQKFRSLVRDAVAEGVDFLVTTGAVSLGRHDYVAEALLAEGAELHFQKCAIRPGKPICFGEIRHAGGRCFLFCLPGNPVSTAVGARFFLAPALRSWLGLAPEQGTQALLAETVRKPDGLTCFFRARFSLAGGRAEVSVLRDQGSHVVGNLQSANCWVRLAERGDQATAGLPVTVVPWEPLPFGELL